jgi:mono/diheme cytochrome c family protein
MTLTTVPRRGLYRVALLGAGFVAAAVLALGMWFMFAGQAEERAGTGEDKASTAALSIAAGEEVYNQRCLFCHQADGRGVPNMQPGLVGSSWLAAEASNQRLARLILFGLNAGDWDVVMPANRDLSNQEIAAVIEYVRDAYGEPAKGGRATSEIVAKARAQGPAEWSAAARANAQP